MAFTPSILTISTFFSAAITVSSADLAVHICPERFISPRPSRLFISLVTIALLPTIASRFVFCLLLLKYLEANGLTVKRRSNDTIKNARLCIMGFAPNSAATKAARAPPANHILVSPMLLSQTPEKQQEPQAKKPVRKYP